VRERLELGPDLGEVARLNGWLAELFAAHRVSDAAAQAAKLCLNEIVANVILYGEARRIAVTVEPEGAALRILVEDDGIAFDPLSAPEAVPMAGLEDARIGGFGIKLFRESSRAASYVRSDGMNRLSFTCG
jgi:anti-sigma regulatory factor (Ser/Thr protein kinase)